jgi:hypothetical protein
MQRQGVSVLIATALRHQNRRWQQRMDVMQIKPVIGSVLALFLGVCASLALAENATRVPGYTIHHNALTTDSLSPQVAKAYNITRSKSRGMLNVSVLREVPGTTGQPVKARVSVHASNLSGQVKTIELREVEDGEAVYYIGDFRVANQETLNFEVAVTPAGTDTRFVARLSHQFFTE